MALENGLIPPTIGVTTLNPELKAEERNVKIVTELTPWPETSIRRASINSFGYGGANAHAILEAADAHIPHFPQGSASCCSSSETTLILPLSAQSRWSLDRMVEDIASSNIDSSQLDDLAFTLSCRRSSLSSRGFLLVNQSTMTSDLHLSNMRGLEATIEPPQLPLAFIFTGQGAQWATMGSLLLDRFSTFRLAIQKLDDALVKLLDPPSWTIEGECVNVFVLI